MSKTKEEPTTKRNLRHFNPPAPGMEVVISGIAGRYPASKNVKHLQENLLNKVDLVTDTDERWDLDHPDIPRRTGKVHDLSKFDALFFGVHFKQAHTMDPMCRMLLEHTYEAIVDAGVHPRQLRGSNTGVFIGACFSESEKTWFYEKLQVNGFGITGCSRAMFANRISYWLGVHGPSYTVDSACSSSLFALEHAYEAIRDGKCDNAIVGGANLCLHPHVSLQFSRLGVLSPDGCCRSFDANANGYARSETVGVMFLQRAKDAKRIYATVVHGKTNSDGFKEQGITFPSSVMQSTLLQDFYLECGINPSVVNFMESHGTGTRVGDPEEINAIEKVFCKDRKEPLRIGSIKSNLGHSEPASGFCSISKVLIAMESGVLPPNLHYKNPREGVKALENGIIKVITEPTPWEGGYVGINSFGFGGANAHILLKHNPKEKVDNGAPKDDLPRLVLVSGRTEEAVDSLLNDVESRPVDVEYIRLLHDVHSDNITGHLYRGYSIIGRQISEEPLRETENYSGSKKPIWFVFSGMGSQWPAMGTALMRFPVFAESIQRCAAALAPKGVDLIDIITTTDKKVFDNIVNSFVGIAAIQIGLVDLLYTLGIVPDNIIGHSVGELGCAYADGCFTAEQMVLSAYSRGMASIESEVIFGSMAAVGLGYNDLKDIMPADVDIACHNSETSATISGPAQSVAAFVAKLQAKNIFAKEVACSNIPYHSRYIAPAGSKLLSYLKQVIPKPNPRSQKWISTSVPQAEWSTAAAKLSSAEYHTNSLLNSVLFEEALKHIPSDAVTIEIAPHGLLQAILRRALEPTVLNIALTKRGHADNAEVFLQALGKLYNAGYHPQLPNIYPEVSFPVSRGTPMISPLVKWEHSDDWYVTKFKPHEKISSGERTIDVTATDEFFELMSGHVIDGRNLLPATGYLHIVWETLGMMTGEFYTQLPVVFEDIVFHRATSIPKEGSLELVVMIQKGSGRFEIVDGNTLVVSGFIRTTSNIAQEKVKRPFVTDDEDEPLTTKDIYKELRLRGYQYAGIYRGLKRASIDAVKGLIAWNSNFVSFMDNMLQLHILGFDTRSLLVPTRIRKLVIDVKEHVHTLRNQDSEEKHIPVRVYRDLDVIVAGGIEIHGPSAAVISRRKPTGDPVLEKYNFVAHKDRKNIPLEEAVRLCVHVALENQPSIKVKTVELFDANSKVVPEDLVSPILQSVLGDLPLIQADISLGINAEYLEKDALNSNIHVVEPKKLANDGTALIAVGYGLLSKNKTDSLEQLLSAVKNGGFLLTRDASSNCDNISYLEKHELHVIVEKQVGKELIILAKKKEKLPRETLVVRVNNNEFDWIEQIQKVLKAETENEGQRSVRLVVVGEKDLESGVLGLVNCLRKEPGGEIIRGVFIQDTNAPPFSLDNPLYRNQLQMDLAINVLNAGNVWGSYRHTLLPALEDKLVYHGAVEQMVRGDLSSLRWLQGPIRPDNDSELLVYITHCSINFRDVMSTTGKLMNSVTDVPRKDFNSAIGFEYCGVTAAGQRIMGISTKAFSNLSTTDRYLRWTIPDNWTMDEAATVPTAYTTCYISLYLCGNMRKGQRVLIHAGSGGVGQAAINLALHEGCEVFTTVGTPEKRKFIKETFPSIPDDHIGNSRDTSFEEMIMTVTKGEGVDIVLNSLAEEKLQASVRCLAREGRFLEIGKFDLASNNKLGMQCFLKEVSFHGVMLDHQLHVPVGKKKLLWQLFTQGLKTGAVKPLTRTLFAKDKLEDAFRYMAAGKHIGKVIIKVREDDKPLNTPIMALPRFHCDENKTYVILGGLGGFGMELADWLIMRDAKKIVLTSRTGVKNGYQRMRIQLWQSYGVKILIISGQDASIRSECEFILKAAEDLGPVDAIFNLAVVLKDGLFTNQTPDAFKESFRSKAWATKTLDEVSRKLCHNLSRFVVFSSVSCGRGNAGQTNYGMANSIMERICEKRVQDGFPGLAIQWGAVGDVGLVADMQEDDKELIIGGTLQQKIKSCLEELDGFLMQDQPVVASMVVAEKRAGGMGANNIVEAVLNIMGLKDIKLVSHHTSLAELGMDSMMAVEIKQTLEREFEVLLSAQDIRSLNFAKLIALAADDDKQTKRKRNRNVNDADNIGGIKLIVHVLDVDITNFEVCMQLNTSPVEGKPEVLLIPGIEGFGSIFNRLGPSLKCPAVSLQMGVRKEYNSSIETMANYLLPHALERTSKSRTFTIVGYSFGALIAIELVRRLEAQGMTGRLVLIDGAPIQMKALWEQHVPSSSDAELEDNVLLGVMDIINPEKTAELVMELAKHTCWEEKLDAFSSRIPAGRLTESLQSQRDLFTSIVERFKALQKYSTNTLRPIKTSITLLKPTLPSVRNIDEDYGLRMVTENQVDIYYADGNHYSMLTDYKVAAAINDEPLEDADEFKASIMEEGEFITKIIADKPKRS